MKNPIIAALTSGLVLFACSKPAEKKPAAAPAEKAPAAKAAPVDFTKATGTVRVNADTSDPAPKAAIEKLVRSFNEAHKAQGLQVELTILDHEGYKTSIRNWLATEPPDVVFWYAGERMRKFVDAKLLDPVSDVWEKGKLSEPMASTKESVTFGGEQYAVPYTFYNWGIYYRMDIFKKYKIAVPKTWEEFKAACAKLKKNGIAPITIGTKNLWPTGGWFDYMDLRVNGYEFHMDLTAGKIPYTDPRVKAVFEKWAEIVKPGYYLKNHSSYTWQEAQAPMYNGKAAMYLIGNFITPNFTKEVEPKMGFFQFPQINPEVKMYEDAPTDTLSVPAKAKNKAGGKAFLAFMAEKASVEAMNAALKQLPTRSDVPALDNRFLKAGKQMLDSAAGTAQFYDRDTDPAMAKAGMKGFQEFMMKPDRLDKILQRMEQTRKRIYRK